jgi:hypothetical protein
MPIDIHGAPVNCGSDSAAAGALGALNGLLGVVGLGGLFNPTKDSTEELEKDRANLQAATEVWNEKLSNAKEQIVQDQLTYLQNITNFSSVQNSAVEQSLQEQIETNFTLIIMLIVLVFFLILFDLF